MLLVSLLTACKQNVDVKNISGRLVTIDSTMVDDTIIAGIVSPYREEIDKQMNRIIGISEKVLSPYYPESPLSNLVSDIIRKRALSYLKSNNADSLSLISLMNIKGLRATLPKGNITVRNIFEIMPFENQIVVLKLSGESVKSFFHYISTTNGEGISGARLVIKDKKAESIAIDGQAIDLNQNYYLATSDYLANGGDYFSMITNPIHSELIGCKIREAIIEYIEELNQNNINIVCNIDGRVIID